MKLVFYSLILNNHQANVADELWNLTGHNYYFVELANLQAEHRKGDSYDYSDRPYLLRAWQSKRITVKQWSWHRRQNVVCSQEYRLCLSKRYE